jgi:hypothetical protein
MKERVWIKDEGVEKGAEKLTPERIEKTINAVFDNEAGSRLKAYVETCAHCGLCSDACHFFLSRDRDPRFSLWARLSKHLGDA